MLKNEEGYTVLTWWPSDGTFVLYNDANYKTSVELGETRLDTFLPLTEDMCAALEMIYPGIDFELLKQCLKDLDTFKIRFDEGVLLLEHI